jgi:hypothetical protein
MTHTPKENWRDRFYRDFLYIHSALIIADRETGMDFNRDSAKANKEKIESLVSLIEQVEREAYERAAGAAISLDNPFDYCDMEYIEGAEEMRKNISKAILNLKDK